MNSLPITVTSLRRPLPEDWSTVGFCRVFTDHQLLMRYSPAEGWCDAQIIPTEDAPRLATTTKVLHYAQGVFEGLKAYRHADGRVGIFRLEAHLERLNRSAERLAIPRLNEAFLAHAVRALIDLDRRWVPENEGCALYIRPVVFATDHTLGAGPSEDFMLAVMLSPASHYYSIRGGATNILVEEEQSRVPSGGTGSVKAIGNYGSSLLATKRANDAGYEQVLWLDPLHHKYVEEVGTMNIFFVIDGRLITPRLTDTIMPGITRNSLLILASDLGIEVEERAISMDEVLEAHRAGRLTECFGSGTAVSVSPIAEIRWGQNPIRLSGGTGASVAARLLQQLVGIQRGLCPDKHGWVRFVEPEVPDSLDAPARQQALLSAVR